VTQVLSKLIRPNVETSKQGQKMANKKQMNMTGAVGQPNVLKQ
jgi:hypothetical protein